MVQVISSPVSPLQVLSGTFGTVLRVLGSTVAVVVAAVFWTWLWGVVGLMLATPLTVCLMVIAKHVPQLSFLDILLGNEPVVGPTKRVYQRLVGGDQEEAAELVDGYGAGRPLVEVYDTMLMSALTLAETHWQRSELDEGRRKFVLQSVKELVDERGEHQQEIEESIVDTPPPTDADGDARPTLAASASPFCMLATYAGVFKVACRKHAWSWDCGPHTVT